MTKPRDAVIRQIRQYQIDRLSSDDPKVREMLRQLVQHLEAALVKMKPV